MRYITVEYHSAIERNEIMPFAATWMDLESAILSKVREGQISCAIPYMWTLKNDTNRLIHKTETEAQRTDAQRTNLRMASGERAGLGVWD